MLIGCIADDFTGASDVAGTFAAGGMKTTLYVGLQHNDADITVEAGVVALKSRTIPAADAVRKSLAALDWLLAQGCRQILFKYCSTFDSTPQGNIGPVAAALAVRLGERRVVFCPAFPANGRSVYQGHLFVRDMLLSESGMRNHPLTPMRDADLRRVLAAQGDWPVEHIDAVTVFQGAEAIAESLAKPERAFVIVDAIRDDDLLALGAAVADRKLVTGGSGIALGLPANFGIEPGSRPWAGEAGPAAILSGSCSEATRAQVARFRQSFPSREIKAQDLMEGGETAADAAAWVLSRHEPALVFTSAEPSVVKLAQDRYGRETIAGRIETFFANLAGLLVDRGIRRLVVAGGETSGAVVEGLGLQALDIGPDIAPGVPALRAPDRPLVLALKSGNFGNEAFFGSALAVLKGSAERRA
ncbi:MAG: 3-oxo-tetronate kinase [Geminicoccaceae bacterium]